MKCRTKLKIITKDGIKRLEDIKIGEFIKCEDGEFYPVKNLLTTCGESIFYRLSNNCGFYLPPRLTVKTSFGFKVPELWDEVFLLEEETTPQVVQKTLISRIMFFNDILIEGNMVTPEGIVLKFQE